MTAPGQPFVPRRVSKPWGFEIVWAETARYAGKTLHIERGHQLSLQYHRVKDEVLHVLAGVVDLEIAAAGEATRRVRLSAGASVHIPPGLRHRLTAIETAEVLEASTPELDDIVRLEDRYGRVG